MGTEYLGKNALSLWNTLKYYMSTRITNSKGPEFWILKLEMELHCNQNGKNSRFQSDGITHICSFDKIYHWIITLLILFY